VTTDLCSRRSAKRIWSAAIHRPFEPGCGPKKRSFSKAAMKIALHFSRLRLECFLVPRAAFVVDSMAVPKKAQLFERHINEFLNEWQAEPILETYVRKRMGQLGVRPKQVGIVDTIENGKAFSLELSQGGRNSRPVWNSDVSKGGVNVDRGIFNPELLSMVAPSWENASLRDRIDAVIIHELAEYNSRAATTASRHRNAILRSAATASPISAGARQILVEYRSWLLRGRKR
jgi:hypothetical protein